jgi:hypothetical protein
MKIKVDEPLEGIQIGERIIQVTAKKALQIRQLIAARRGKDIRISQELRQENMLPSSFRNQTASLIRSNYSAHDAIDTRVINKTRYVNGRQVKVLETRFADHLRRAWSI